LKKRVINSWNNLPQHVAVDSNLLIIFQKRLDQYIDTYWTVKIWTTKVELLTPTHYYDDDDDDEYSFQRYITRANRCSRFGDTTA